MNKYIAKLFYKNKYVVVIVTTADKRQHKYYTIPDGNLIKLKDKEIAFQIDEEKIVELNGERIIYYNYLSPIGINFFPSKEELQFIPLTPDKLYAGIENNLIKEMFVKFVKNDKIKPIEIVSIITLLLVVGVIAFMYISFKDINTILQQIKEILDTFFNTGGA